MVNSPSSVFVALYVDYEAYKPWNAFKVFGVAGTFEEAKELVVKEGWLTTEFESGEIDLFEADPEDKWDGFPQWNFPHTRSWLTYDVGEDGKKEKYADDRGMFVLEVPVNYAPNEGN